MEYDNALHIPNTDHKVSNVGITNELKCFETTSNRTENIKKLYASPLSIPPTSVQAKRAFSADAQFVSKSRSSLSTSTLDTVIAHYAGGINTLSTLWVSLSGSACTDLLCYCIDNKRIVKYTKLYCILLHIIWIVLKLTVIKLFGIYH